mmetsp:Transcript_24952/g.69355  ORF Transcript_24952/g.69355 Transcript_24952/m.69355 type:complete len:137 (+) Transcript_24952:749-1159(+)
MPLTIRTQPTISSSISMHIWLRNRADSKMELRLVGSSLDGSAAAAVSSFIFCYFPYDTQSDLAALATTCHTMDTCASIMACPFNARWRLCESSKLLAERFTVECMLLRHPPVMRYSYSYARCYAQHAGGELPSHAC